ncbi:MULTISPECIES: sulfurtransferase complex subunit TusD [unclassified Modicisalibacter]|uniref:sulfurtransferase complex subunit TusD n=1 Tax=unclassified Modicisalibacter TaxID=2679913 RepID=UPI001CCF93D5|nr:MULTISPECIES: sulfurtransferase complex subunit TusD [unclassified Modicisalibacter]MBZ9556694.1 sulfurtransferase complex subunit TusD [Modicisalibacter sp. R2A 31.J]MBZ9574837.1 sulfurtransferase complex subunit TusD [Modicisalibacter sp. MOD 31.J]
MRYAVVVQGGPYSHQAAHSALRFARAVIAAGHRLQTVFFYHDGVYNASRLAAPPQDEPQLREGWQALASEHGCELLVCIAAALRRGLIDEGEAARHGKPAHSLEAPFVLTGLGQLVQAAIDHDRLVTFSP